VNIFTVGHEEHAYPIFPVSWQLDVQLVTMLSEELVRDLKEQSRTVTGVPVRPHGSAVQQILQNLYRVLDDGVRLLAAYVGHKANAAGIVFVARII
jgi:hypothetical protein